MKRLDDIVHALEGVREEIASGALPRDYGPFASTSLRFVAELIARLDDGGFHEPAWVRGLALDADERYLEMIRTPSARPGPWKVTFDVADRNEGRVMRNLLLGINAHIFYDLVVTLSTADPLKSPSRRQDFERLNDIIRTATDGVQNLIESSAPPWLLAGDVLAGRADEWATWTMFRVARGRAFDDGVRLMHGETTLAAVERRSTLYAHLLARLPI